MKFSLESPVKWPARVVLFAVSLVVVFTPLMSVAFSQGQIVKVEVPKHIPDQAAAAARIMGAERTFGGKSIPPHAYESAMKQWAAISPDTVESSSESRIRRPRREVERLFWMPIGPDGMTDGPRLPSILKIRA